MARIVDITDKLNFEEQPALRIKGVEIPINNKAVDVLKITPLMEKEKVTGKDFLSVYKTVFPPESREMLEKLNLDMDDFTAVVWEGAKLISNIEDDEGEDETPTTT